MGSQWFPWRCSARKDTTARGIASALVTMRGDDETREHHVAPGVSLTSGVPTRGTGFAPRVGPSPPG